MVANITLASGQSVVAIPLVVGYLELCTKPYAAILSNWTSVMRENFAPARPRFRKKNGVCGSRYQDYPRWQLPYHFYASHFSRVPHLHMPLSDNRRIRLR